MAMANGSKVLTWVERDVVTERGAGCRFVVLVMHQTVRTQTYYAIADLLGTANIRADSCSSRSARGMGRSAEPTADKRAHHRRGEGREAASQDRPAITRKMAPCLTERSGRLDESVGVLSQARP